MPPVTTAEPSAASNAAPAAVVWDLRLLGGMRARADGVGEVNRFRSQKVAALLARLALPPGRMHAREELADLLWPDSSPGAGRLSLRNALANLRRSFEAPGVAGPGVVLASDGHAHVWLRPEAVSADVFRFEAALKRAQSAAGAPAREAAHRPRQEPAAENANPPAKCGRRCADDGNAGGGGGVPGPGDVPLEEIGTEGWVLQVRYNAAFRTALGDGPASWSTATASSGSSPHRRPAHGGLAMYRMMQGKRAPSPYITL